MAKNPLFCWGILTSLLISAGSLSGCWSSECNDTGKDDGEVVANILEVGKSRTEPRVLDVVLVHGLGGDVYSTWQATDCYDSFWPQWLANDLKDCGVYSIDYASSPVNQLGKSMAIQDRAGNLLNRLHLRNLGRDRPVVFVTHSLGGIVVKEMLHKGLTHKIKDEEDFAKSVRGVMFLSTPHQGSHMADFGDKLGKLIEEKSGLSVPSVLIDQLKANDPHLRQLNTWYVNNLWSSIDNMVVYEDDNTYGMRIVDQMSANPGIPGIKLIPMDADHLTICKPKNDTDDIYLTIKNFVEKVRTKVIERTDRSSDELTILSHSAGHADMGRWNFVIRFSDKPFKDDVKLTVQVSPTEDFADTWSTEPIEDPKGGTFVFAMAGREQTSGFIRLCGEWADGYSACGKAQFFEIPAEETP